MYIRTSKINNMKLNEIQDLIKLVAKSGVEEVEIEQKDFKITIKADPSLKKKRGNGDVPPPPPQQQVIHQMPIAVQPMTTMAQPVVAQPSVEAAVTTPVEPVNDSTLKYIEVKSPMIGTFYRSQSPDKPPFVEVGDQIKEGSVVCIIEAMKLFNEIESEVTGKIVKILVDDNTPVEYDQPLFLIDPS